MKLRVLILPALLAAAVSAVATSVVVVEPGEAVVVRRFGKALEPAWGPGLHFGLPWKAERRDRLKLDQVRKVEVGLGGEPLAELPPGEGEYLTADGNFVIARAVVQYRIDNPVRFVTATDEIERVLIPAVESAISRAFAKRSIDKLLASARAEAAREITDSLSDFARKGDLGISLLNVSLTETRPPAEVSGEFNDAQAAASERESRVRDATTEAGLRKTKAESAARSIKESAQAKADRVLALAKGKAAAFGSLAAQAKKSPALTMRRLYSDTLAEILPKVGRKVLNSGTGVDLSVFGTEKAP